MKFTELSDEQWRGDRAHLPPPARTGRPRKRPKTLYADTKYNMSLNRFYLDGKGIRSQMPEPSTKKRRGRGRPRLLREEIYDRVRPAIDSISERARQPGPVALEL